MSEATVVLVISVAVAAGIFAAGLARWTVAAVTEALRREAGKIRREAAARHDAALRAMLATSRAPAAAGDMQDAWAEAFDAAAADGKVH